LIALIINTHPRDQVSDVSNQIGLITDY
jgi:hypothetical protein